MGNGPIRVLPLLTRICSRRSFGHTGIAIGLALLAFLAVSFSQPTEADAGGKVVASRMVSAEKGGEVRTRLGVSVVVPARVLVRKSRVSIRQIRPGRYDIHIHGRWHGFVRVTLPLRGRGDAVVHRVGRTWLQESARRGRRTVWVSNLSVFDTIKNLPKKTAASLCLTTNPKKFVQCLMTKGIKSVDSKVVNWLLKDLAPECAAKIISSKGGVGTMWAAFGSKECLVHTGDPRGWFGQVHKNTIVTVSATGTSYFFDANGKPHWIPDGRTYNCLTARGLRVVVTGYAQAAIDDSGDGKPWATCESPPLATQPPPATQVPPVPTSPVTPAPARAVKLARGPVAPAGYRYAISLIGFPSGSGVSVSCRDSVDPRGFFTFTMSTDASGAAFTQSQCYSGDGPDHWVVASGVESNHVSWGATPPSPSTTWPETTGGSAHTWTNYTNAGGTQGPTIAANQTVQIACKATGFRVANGNTWWYRIAQAPWSNRHYVSADAFYNNGATSGPLAGTPFVDTRVRDC